MENQYLLTQDVDGLGRSGDLVPFAKIKPGFLRNFLLPKKKAVRASKHTIRLQEKLKQERKKQTLLDVEEAKKIIESLKGKTFETKTKVDAEGHMYGSVSQTDIVKLLKENGIEIDKKMVRIPGAIKSLGDHTISLHLKEGVLTDFVLKVLPEEETPTEPEPKAEA
ncbi:MAG: 50S ribosomal protein L9 [Chlamydiae bacterium]|nr:50S ribosomal protein L9 [Chlamydiota bacterium]